jgi:hypothetical protein
VADAFQDVAIIFTGQSPSPLQKSVDQPNRAGVLEREGTIGGWLPLNADNALRAIYSVSGQQEWLFVPNSREAVEEVVSWLFGKRTFVRQFLSDISIFVAACFLRHGMSLATI